MTDVDALHRSLAEVARDLGGGDHDTAETVEAITTAVVEQIDGADAAGVTFVRRGGGVENIASTDPLVADADDLQVELGEGPCLQALHGEVLVHAPDLATETRWPRWVPAVRERHGVESMLCTQLFVHERQVGALNLYARRAHAFTADDLAEVTLWAAHAAVALAASRKIDQLESAILTRGEIGQAQGIIMERFDLDSRAAFEVLKRLSQHQNVRLALVAKELVRTRKMPSDDV